MEYLDLVDENGIPTGISRERSIVHEKGLLHRTAHIWVIRKVDEKYQVLLQKRSYDKESFPGCLDTSSAGHISAGDEPLESALRELSEELGINAKEEDLSFMANFHIQYEKEFHGKLFKDNEVVFAYAYEKPVELSDITIQKEELEGVDWYDFEETVIECGKKNPLYCVPPGGLQTVQSYLDKKRQED